MSRDALVVGAGPAGSLTGLLLARRGWAVELIEQSRFPRDKVCGECVSSLGAEVLARAGLLEEIAAAGAVPLTRAELHAGRRSTSLRLPRTMWGISRAKLDQILLDRARNAGVVVRQPVRCEATIPGIRPHVRLRDLVTNRLFERDCSCMVVADGKGAAVGERPATTGDFGVKAHFTNVDGPRDAIELFGCAGCYGGLAAVEGERWNASFSVSAARLRRVDGNLEALWAELVSENQTLGRRMRSAIRTGPFLAAPLPRYRLRKPPSAQIVYVGNGAAAMEPIGGEGIGVALRSGELAAATIDESRRSETLRDHYRSLWRLRRPGCRAAAIVASSPAAAAAAIMILSTLPVGGAAMRLMGKV